VLHSRWAYWFGVPVSMFALATYLVILAASLRLSKGVPAPAQRRAWAVLVPCALLVSGAAIWFVALQILVVHAICPYCMAAHAAGSIAGLLLLFAAPFGNAPEKPWEIEKQVFVASRLIGKMVAVALAGLALLMAGQIVYQPPTSREIKQESILAKAPPPVAPMPDWTQPPKTQTAPRPAPPPEPKPEPKSAPPLAAPTIEAAPWAKRLFPVYEGRFSLEVSEVPLIGSPTNEHIAVSLFDYTCHHCRAMHPRLVEAQRAFNDQLVILNLPMPLDPQCNQTVTRLHPDHTNACEYARLGLSVWRADRTKHHEFEDWLFTGDKPPPLADARERAQQLVGAEALDQAAADPWVESQLKLDIAIYEIAYRAGQGSMPQLILGSTVAVGTYAQPELMKLFSDKLGLNPSP
jgi:hypothetical protein